MADLLRRFDQLGLRAKLGAGFGALIALALGAGLVAVVSLDQARAAVETFLDHDNRIAELTLRSGALMLKARRGEKDFLLKVREYGYEEARSRYVTLVQADLAEVRDNMETVRSLSGDAGIAEEAREIEQISWQYEAGFAHMAELWGRLASRDTGLEAQLRGRARAIEMLLDKDPPELTIGLSNLSRAQKDFLLQGVESHVQAFDRGVERYDEAIRRSSAPSARKVRLLKLTADYQSAFHQYVALSRDIELESQAYLSAVHTVEPTLEHLHAQASKAAIATRATLDRLGRATAWTVSVATFSAALLGLAVALFISSHVSQKMRVVGNFAGRLAAGDLSARVPPGGAGEFGALTTCLNHMADELQSANDRQAEQSSELHRLNRALRVLSQCNETLVRAGSEGELVHAICRHIVELGGYRFAWVGYSGLGNAACIERVAHAGVDADFVQKIERGLASCLGLPLQTKDGVLGMLRIYSEEEGAFDGPELKVLQELADNLTYGIASLREGEARRRVEQELERNAKFDALTGLANRLTFEARLAQSLAEAKRAGRKLSVLFIDLDHFKDMNGVLGLALGDRLLIEVAQRLRASVHDSDTVARLGADVFVVALKDLNDAADGAAQAATLIGILSEPVTLGEHEVRPVASIGLSVFPDDGADAASLLKNAATAANHAKFQGGGRYHFFAAQMNIRAQARLALQADLHRAIERNELLLHFQPKVSLTSGVVVGAEALLRWQHPTRGLVSPAEFIPVAEETGQIEAIGEWVIVDACRQIRAWLDAGLAVPPVAINLAARQFRRPDLDSLIARSLAAHSLDASLLEFEITESALIDHMEAATATARRLKALGVGLSLDDFGTGYSSLSHLRRFPIDHLKIDRSFVRDIATDPDSAAICDAVIGLAHSLKMRVVAEGVETEVQIQYLRRQHCDQMQGYFFSRPLAQREFALLLASGKKLYAHGSPGQAAEAAALLASAG